MVSLSVGEHIENGWLNIAGRKNGIATLKKGMKVSYKTKHVLTTQLSDYIIGLIPEK